MENRGGSWGIAGVGRRRSKSKIYTHNGSRALASCPPSSLLQQLFISIRQNNQSPTVVLLWYTAAIIRTFTKLSTFCLHSKHICAHQRDYSSERPSFTRTCNIIISVCTFGETWGEDLWLFWETHKCSWLMKAYVGLWMAIWYEVRRRKNVKKIWKAGWNMSFVRESTVGRMMVSRLLSHPHVLAQLTNEAIPCPSNILFTLSLKPTSHLILISCSI